ncbi:FxLYD domain-containing protein [Pseudomonas arsenicoxydans]|uniref:Uncharacterized protein n=1 Tax=Pseudomonas arsenicoxydans TaxID=702115 RepID=A0A502GWD3_9PSED|nr:FxLYD domain-containing protein [Pseudomonas arsenicoxydans]TPG65698.1 hypothetical protein EAH78_31645 [Pseudomonas arsenicoxydans]
MFWRVFDSPQDVKTVIAMSHTNGCTRWGSFVAALGFSLNGWAAGEVYLNFHTSGSINDESFVRGSVTNSGDALIRHGYVVVTLLDVQCRPLKSVLHSFDAIEPGQAQDFRVPVEGRIQRYRLASVRGFDHEGFEVPTVDAHAPIFKVREPEERGHCAQARKASQREHTPKV